MNDSQHAPLRWAGRARAALAVVAVLAFASPANAGLTLTSFGTQVLYAVYQTGDSTQNAGAVFNPLGQLVTADPRLPALLDPAAGLPFQVTNSQPGSSSLFAPSIAAGLNPPSGSGVPAIFGRAATGIYSQGVGQQGVLTSQGGLYFDIGTNLADNLGPGDTDKASVSFTTASATFRNDGPGPLTIRPASILSIRGTLGAGGGSYVAAGLQTRVSLSGQEGVTTLAPVVLAAARPASAGSAITVQATGPNPLNSASLSFSNTSSQLFASASSFADSTVTLAFGQSITIQAMLTLIADPGSSIQITDALAPGYTGPEPEFGAYAGGTFSAPVPEPSAAVLVGLGLASAAALRRARRARPA